MVVRASIVLLWDNKSQNDRPLLPNSRQAEGLIQDILLAMELFKRGGAFEDAFNDHAEANSATPNIVAHNLCMESSIRYSRRVFDLL
jgi:hypothetical protein